MPRSWLLALLLLVVGCACSEADKERCRSMGYDSEDVQVFVTRIGSTCFEFFRSQGLRRQYELFRNGVSSDFQNQARSKQQSDEATSQGFVYGIAAGTSSGRSR